MELTKDGHGHETTRPEAIRLRDGTSMVIRRMRADDVARLGRLARRLSSEALRLRFFTARKRFTQAQLRELVKVDFEQSAAFVAQCTSDDEIRAVGRLAADSATNAEVAFIVEDTYQGHGIGTELLHHLVAFGRAKGFDTFSATVLAENRDMFDVFEGSEYPMRSTWTGPTVVVTLDIRPGAGKQAS